MNKKITRQTVGIDVNQKEKFLVLLIVKSNIMLQTFFNCFLIIY